MIIGYDRNPNATPENKVHTLAESVQMAFNIVPTEPITRADLERLEGLAHVDGSHSSGGGGGGSGGVTSYNDLTDKPMIEYVTLQGNRSFPDLNLNALTNTEIQDIFDNLI